MNKSVSGARGISLVFLCLPCFIYLWLVWPGIREGLPFFYREDEAHHFNRVVNMVKEGRLDPQYFHKPSLHFYLRMPVVAASFLREVRQGRARKLTDINTFDPYGVADYAFSASHPGMVKWNRAFSVSLNLLLIILTFFTARAVSRSNVAAFSAALLAAVSPDLITNSAIVGVDTLMALMCMATIYAGVRLYKRFNTGMLIACGLLAGLAVSSKYNAAPVAVIPLLVCLLRRRFTGRNCLLALAVPLAGFVLGSPYILVSIPLFIDHLGYEIWHYRVAGHSGHMAEPGLPQMVFYSRWLAGHALGLMGALLGGAGMIFLALSRRRLNWVFLGFPVLFFMLMIAQRANFTRNMLPLIPCLAISAAAFCNWLVRACFSRSLRKIARPLFTTALFLPPFLIAGRARTERLFMPESRSPAAQWIETHLDSSLDTAVTGQLQFPLDVYRLPGVTKVDGKDLDPLELYLLGFDRLVVGPGSFSQLQQLSYLEQEKEFSGTQREERIIVNPAIRIYRFDPNEELRKSLDQRLVSRGLPRLSFKTTAEGGSFCYRGTSTPAVPPSEGHCWLQSRFESLVVDDAPAQTVRLRMRVMTPWPKQQLLLSLPGWQHEISFSSDDIGKWKEVDLAISREMFRRGAAITAAVSQVHSPYEQGISRDSRRLGVAIKDLRLE